MLFVAARPPGLFASFGNTLFRNYDPIGLVVVVVVVVVRQTEQDNEEHLLVRLHSRQQARLCLCLASIWPDETDTIANEKSVRDVAEIMVKNKER